MTDQLPGDVRVAREEPLSRHTYIRLGGPAQFYAEPATLAELDRLVAWAIAEQLPLRVLGGGSNLLVADAGVPGLVLSLRRCCGGIGFEGERVVAGAAVMLPALARAAAERSLGGLEFAIGIPGTVGGALQSNAGIGDGRDIGRLVDSVEVLGARGRRTLRRFELQFAYRRSSLRGSGVMVLAATLRLEPRPRTEIDAEMSRLLAARQATQPTAGPNAGSIFRNPEGDHAGRLIEAAGCKGWHEDGARVSEQHANFIVHDGGASADSVVTLMARVQAAVLAHSGVRLQPEIEWWGSGPLPEPWVDPAAPTPDDEEP